MVGDRGCAIWVGAPEAAAIAMALQGVTAERPMTHDLLRHLLEGLGGTLLKVTITALRGGTFHAELLCWRGGDAVFSIDARPSDAIALALRCHAPLLAADVLLTDDATPSAEDRPLDPAELRARLERLDPQDFGRFLP